MGLCCENSNVTYKYNYTRQKINAEKYNFDGVNFRIGKLFGHPDINKQNKLTEYIVKNDNITLDEVCFNPTSLKQILKVILFELFTGELNGIYNLSNDGFVSHYKYGVFINDNLGKNKKINKIEKLNKIFDNYGKFTMSCDKIKKNIKLDNWKYDMIEYLEKLKET